MTPHGSRQSYRHGCRCVACRAANAAYVATRRLAPVGTIDATDARAHLTQVHTLGIGIRQAARLAGVGTQLVKRVLYGRQSRLRPASAAKLLAIRPALARGALVPGTKTWRFIDSLEREGFTRRELGFRLGARSQQLQLARRVRVATALKVATLYHRLAA